MAKPNVWKMKKKNDVEGLTKALKYKDKDVRGDATRALGKLGDARAVEPLIQALRDENEDVQLIFALRLK